MRKVLSVGSILAALMLLVSLNTSASLAAAPDAVHGNAFHVPNSPVKGQAAPASRLSNLVYHTGGSVQTGTHHTYAIYWGTNFSSGYQAGVNGYFGNVAAASGQTSNVYYSDTQYYQTIGGTTTHITYSEAFGGSWQDSTLPSSNGCNSTAGGSICVSDAQIQGEVTKAIQANGWPTGLGNEYFVLLENGMSTCLGSSCAFTTFCAYHTNYSLSGATVLYANMPYTGHNLSACGGGNYPSGNAAVDSVLSVTSHEANETITDALGNAWYDRSGNENGDKCAWKFGTQLGGSSGSYYNQVINGAHYELQGEWSNASGRCVWQGH